MAYREFEESDTHFHSEREHRGYDGRRIRQPVQRRPVDYGTPIVKYMEKRIFYNLYDPNDMQPIPKVDSFAKSEVLPVFIPTLDPIENLPTRYVHSSVNKDKCPINVVSFTPEARRLITGTSKGELTLWNGLCFKFETILQAHNSSIRALKWTYDGNWMITSDNEGIIKYWQPNMNNVKEFQTPTQKAIRGLAFSPTDMKFAAGSDDATTRIYDFVTCQQERELTGHGWDVRDVDWHPFYSLLATGSKENSIKFWDPSSGAFWGTFHNHKSTVTKVKWNLVNGYYLLSSSRDQLIKLFDIRMFKEVQTYKGHEAEVVSIAWHPLDENIFVSGDLNGKIKFWITTQDDPFPVQTIEDAHEGSIFDLAWHPLGHILCSASNDRSIKFWSRHRPGELKLIDHISSDSLLDDEKIISQSIEKEFVNQMEIEIDQQKESCGFNN
ncbi:wd40 repeat protein [Anaeramoeba ignava]|uniref:Wd40 repeat protein n=1 Tax=Anaeramoeba ignava TaxID=1746090 RepID=A0A9Q0LFF1_ANAIG|nr:wd40 repeat protein [Anaeramoeba ignava]